MKNTDFINKCNKVIECRHEIDPNNTLLATIEEDGCSQLFLHCKNCDGVVILDAQSMDWQDKSILDK